MRKISLSILVFLFFISGIVSAQTLLTPTSESKTFYPFPHFTWSENSMAFTSVSDPVFYEIEIASDANFNNIVDIDTVYINRYINDLPLEPGDYYWKVRSCTKNVANNWSSIAHFKITPCDEIVQVAYIDGASDHHDAVLEALSRAKSLASSGKSVRIEFTKGTYKYNKASKAFISLSNTRNMIINGNESMIQSLRYNGALSQLINVDSVVITGFKIEFPAEKTFLQGWIKAVNSETGEVTVKLDKDYHDYDSAYVKQGADAICLLDPEINGCLKTNTYNFFPIRSITRSADDCWDLKLIKQLMIKDFTVGDRFIHFIRNKGMSLNNSLNSRLITYSNITSYGASNVHYSSFDGSLVNILHCNTKIADGRWFSGNADGVHCRGSKIGSWIEGCNINAIGDDGIALYARPATINQVQPNGISNALVLYNNFMNLESGNEVAFFDPEKGKILLEAKVSSVQLATDNSLWNVTFSKDIPNEITSGSDILRSIQIWNRSKSCGDFMIRNNEISNIRRYGTVFRAQRGIVEKNIYHGVSNSSVISVNEPIWPNGLYCSDIIIRDNFFGRCGFEKYSTPPVTMNFQEFCYVNPPDVGPNYQTATDLGHRRILIEKNEFDCAEKDVLLASTKDVVIRDNTITNNCKKNIEVEQNNAENIQLDINNLTTYSLTTLVEIYPSPVIDTIQIKSKIKNSAFVIRDMKGRIVYQARLSGNKVNVSFLPCGTYIIIIDDKAIKFIKANI